jgi:hypothetical protein
LLVGLEQSRSILSFRALAGPAVFGGASGLGGQAQVDAAIGLTSRINRAASHVAAVVAARGSVVARFNGETLRLGSLEFGFRLR